MKLNNLRTFSHSGLTSTSPPAESEVQILRALAKNMPTRAKQFCHKARISLLVNKRGMAQKDREDSRLARYYIGPV
jgi:hypothetical protein